MRGFAKCSEATAYASWNGRKKPGALLPPADLELTITHEGNGKTCATCCAQPSGIECLQQLIA
jgi:hypothetical protein